MRGRGTGACSALGGVVRRDSRSRPCQLFFTHLGLLVGEDSWWREWRGPLRVVVVAELVIGVGHMSVARASLGQVRGTRRPSSAHRRAPHRLTGRCDAAREHGGVPRARAPRETGAAHHSPPSRCRPCFFEFERSESGGLEGRAAPQQLSRHPTHHPSLLAPVDVARLPGCVEILPG